MIVAAIALAVPIATALVMADPNSLCLLPMLVLAVPLWLRRYPGERKLASFLRRRAERTSGERSPVRALRPPTLSVVRGGLLLACSLAVRPPPRRLLAAAAR